MELERTMTQLEAGKIPSDHYQFCADIINFYWGSQFRADGEIMAGRFESGHPFIVVYGRLSEEERAVLKSDYGWNVPQDESVPLGILEGVLTDKPLLPYLSLTNEGLWSRKKGNTLVMVDVNRVPIVESDVATFLMDCTKRHISTADYQAVLTLTPNIAKVREWHINEHGAKETDFYIKNCRPSWKNGRISVGDVPQDVLMLSYSHFLPKKRKRAEVCGAIQTKMV